jgi:hypothetical protein
MRPVETILGIDGGGNEGEMVEGMNSNMIYFI